MYLDAFDELIAEAVAAQCKEVLWLAQSSFRRLQLQRQV
jgi:hypothetical protein